MRGWGVGCEGFFILFFVVDGFSGHLFFSFFWELHLGVAWQGKSLGIVLV